MLRLAVLITLSAATLPAQNRDSSPHPMQFGSRYPDKVGGLIYLDAANGYAYYDRVNGDIILRKYSDVRSPIPAIFACPHKT